MQLPDPIRASDQVAVVGSACERLIDLGRDTKLLLQWALFAVIIGRAQVGKVIECQPAPKLLIVVHRFAGQVFKTPRDEVQVEFQKFSTPPAQALVLVKAARREAPGIAQPAIIAG